MNYNDDPHFLTKFVSPFILNYFLNPSIDLCVTIHCVRL